MFCNFARQGKVNIFIVHPSTIKVIQSALNGGNHIYFLLQDKSKVSVKTVSQIEFSYTFVCLCGYITLQHNTFMHLLYKLYIVKMQDV